MNASFSRASQDADAVAVHRGMHGSCRPENSGALARQSGFALLHYTDAAIVTDRQSWQRLTLVRTLTPRCSRVLVRATVNLPRYLVLFLLSAMSTGLHASEAPTYEALARDAFRWVKAMQQAGQLPGFPPEVPVKMNTRGPPNPDVIVAFPVTIAVEVRLSDAPAGPTLFLSKVDADAEWHLSEKPATDFPFSRAPSMSVVGNPALREELLARVARDQEVRWELIKSGVEHPDEAVIARMNAIDGENLAWLKVVVAKHGLPGPELVGDDGAYAAFLLVQHADLEFQQQMLPSVRNAYEAGTLSGECYALLSDRVLVGTGKQQVYGTQTRWKDHVLVAQPIEEPEYVDERRANLGLTPLAEYLRLINEQHGIQTAP